ncbi:MAG TPA: pectinesterase family protein, partial [Polyangiaceae bacterium]
MKTRLNGSIAPALFALMLAAACSSNDNPSGGGGSTGGSAGTGGNATGGAGGGTGGTTGTGGGTGGATGTGGTTGTGGAGGVTGTGGASGGGTGGIVDAGVTDASTGTGGGTGTTDASGSEGGLVLGGTATRPQISASDAAKFTIATYLAQTGNVATPTSDPWDPTAGVTTTTTPDFIVDGSGVSSGTADGGTFTTVQSALDAAIARGGTNRIFIQVMPGTYREVICVRTGPPITLFSAETDAGTFPTIVFSNLAGTAPPEAGAPPLCFGGTLGATYGTDNSATFAVAGANFQAKNLVISNDGDVASLTGAVAGQTQGVALHTRGDKAIFENIRFLGHQDTVEVKTSNVAVITRSYFKSSYIAGDVDFVFGRGTAVFDNCDLHIVTGRPATVTATMMNNGAPRLTGDVIAPSTNAPNGFGFLVINSSFTADANATAGGSTLGRAYDEGVAVGDAGSILIAYANLAATGTYPNGQAVIRDSTIGAHINVAT